MKGQIVFDAELGPTQGYKIYIPPGVLVHHESEPENEQLVKATKDSAEGEEAEFLTGIILGPADLTLQHV